MKIFGILNITPDSFSDGGNFITPENALERARQMMADGAYAIDIGAESTRPGAATISLEEEWQRLEPIISSLTCPISLDTRNAETARKALQFPHVKYLNDVSGFKNPEMLKIAADSGVKIIAMHSLTVPADKSITIKGDVFQTLQTFIRGSLATFLNAGISREKIIFDPGIGFGKTSDQSVEIVKLAADLAHVCHELGTEILYGHSRKSFLGGNVAERDTATAEITAYLQKANVDCIRVHNVEINRRILST